MEWLRCIRKTIELIENHLTAEITMEEIAMQVYVSPFFLQKGFSVMTGFSIAEYTRNRRLYQAAIDLKNTDEKILDLALKYGYETPESFTRAFTRFHGSTPTQVRLGARIQTFLPLVIDINIHGGNQMNVKIKKIFPFKIIGFEREFSAAEEFEKIPKFWDEINEQFAETYAGKTPVTAQERAVADNCIGEYGVCIGQERGKTKYLIAGKYTGGEVPEGMTVCEIEGGDFAVFECIGPMPDAIQSVTTKIFKEWLPGNPDYQLASDVTIEWYDFFNGSVDDPNYRSAVWLPVKAKKNSVQ